MTWSQNLISRMMFFPRPNPFRGILFLPVLLSLAYPHPALAVRPFVTDDARVVGAGNAQIETSVHGDKTFLQNLNLFAIGPTDRLEATLGFVGGIPREGDAKGKLEFAGPILQLKYLVFDPQPNSYPGLAFAAGNVPPIGGEAIRVPSSVWFLYVAATESLFNNDRVLIHANLGAVSAREEGEVRKIDVTWGVGAQVRLWRGLHSVTEIFSGDPYSGGTGGAIQAGFRYIISDDIQVDATFGSGLWGTPRLDTFFGAGLRIVFERLWGKKK